MRFWAGTSFENRASAPFRVMQDGSVVMSKANVTGVVNATSGSIGGFNISSGKIGYGSSSEMDTTYGLALLRNYIRFTMVRNVYCWDALVLWAIHTMLYLNCRVTWVRPLKYIGMVTVKTMKYGTSQRHLPFWKSIDKWETCRF